MTLKHPKKGVRAQLLRHMLAPSLASTIPTFAYFNHGEVKEFKGDRVCVEWNGVGKLWFDKDALMFWKS